MDIKTKNRLTIAFLGVFAFAIYLYALPREIFVHLFNALKSVF